MRRTPEVEAYLAKARHALQVAAELYSSGYISDASSKIYYAMFYAAQALLKSEDIHVVKHSAVESALGFHFAKTGRLEPKLHRMFIKARELREIADYGIFEEVDEETAILKIEEGKIFVAAIEDVLGKANHT